MYTGNGVTTDFPLPDGVDGSTVWLTPPGGQSIMMETGATYTIVSGAVRFIIPPPNGWTVSFCKPAEDGQVMTDGYVVVYANGTMKTVSEDPAELVEQALALLAQAKKEREETAALIASKGAEVKTLADEAKAAIEGRLLNYGARAEEAIAAAASAARADAAERVSAAIEELRAGQESVTEARDEIRLAQATVRNAAKTAALEAAQDTENEVHDCCREALEAYEKIRALSPELEQLAEQARSAATTAGREVAQTMTAQYNVLLEDLRGIYGRLNRDVERETERAEKRHAEKIEEMSRIRDEAERAARKASLNEEGCRRLAVRTEETEGRVRRFAERVSSFENAWNARISREIEARRAKEEN